MMIMAIAVLAGAATSFSGYDLLNDPSLAIAPTHIVSETSVSSSSMPSVVLSYSGLSLTWDDQSETFALTVDSQAVSDLTTFTDSRGWESFAGDFDQGVPGTFGSVIFSSQPGGSYSVEVTLPGEYPALYEVSPGGPGDPGDPVAMQVCDCSDRIDLTCTTIKCRNSSTCDAGDETCQWFAVAM